MNKITEILTEPSKIYVGSTFLLKIKVNRAITYSELKNKKYTEIQKYKYENLIKGV